MFYKERRPQSVAGFETGEQKKILMRKKKKKRVFWLFRKQQRGDEILKRLRRGLEGIPSTSKAACAHSSRLDLGAPPSVLFFVRSEH